MARPYRQEAEIGISPQQQVDEVGRCLDDPVYFINRYVKVYDAAQATWIPFRLWPEQEDAVGVLERENRIVILKARQVGLSWLVLSYILHGSLFRPIFSSLIFSRRDTEAIYLLDERLRGMFQNLPQWLVQGVSPSLGGDNKHTWVLNNGSSVRAFAPQAGDSYTASLVLVDEADLVPDLGKLLRSVKPTVDNGGKLVLLSRSNKDRPMSQFKRIYQGAKSKTNSYTPIFLPWSIHPGRDSNWYEEQKRDSLDSTGSLDDLHEAYPCTDTEALRAATKGKRLNSERLEQCYQEKELQQDERVELLSERYPEVRVYLFPEPTRLYSIGVDPAEGVPGGNDSSVSVFDTVSGEEALVCAGLYDISSTGELVAVLSALYNHAPALVERNNHGHAVLLWLTQNSNTPLLCDEDGRPGWRESKKSKALLYSKFSEALRYGEVLLHDIESVGQLASIVASTLEAPEGLKDDTAMSTVLGYQATGMAYTVEEDRAYREAARIDY